MKQMLNAALVFAANKHDGQYDKGGNPYITHVLKVQYLLKTDDEELQCAALLHDCVEDTDTTLQDLYDIGMSKRVVDIVYLLTKKSGEDYESYIQNILTCKDAIRVKMADVRHNMDLRRLKGVTDKDIARMVKYIHTYNTLKNALENFGG